MPIPIKLYNILASIRLHLSLLIFCILFITNACLFAESAPSVSLKVDGTNLIKLSLKVSSKHKLSNSRLLIVRSVNGNLNFNRIANIRVGNKRPSYFVDRIKTNPFLVSYRSRLVGKIRSGWSKSVSVIFKVDSQGNSVATIDDPGISLDNGFQISVGGNVASNVQNLQAGVEVVLPSGFTYCPRDSLVTVLSRVNAVRAANNVAAVTEDPHLINSSRNFAAKIAIASVLSHDGWFQNILAWGFFDGHSYFGQNIGKITALSADLIMDGWLQSPLHKDNILNPNYLYLGIGCVIDPNGYSWWVQDFGG